MAGRAGDVGPVQKEGVGHEGAAGLCRVVEGRVAGAVQEVDGEDGEEVCEEGEVAGAGGPVERGEGVFLGGGVDVQGGCGEGGEWVGGEEEVEDCCGREVGEDLGDDCGRERGEGGHCC